jgi:hypothetical protein
MTEAMAPCPTGKKGRHDLSVIVPESDQNPVLLFCIHCGMTARHSVEVPAPLDDLPADAIRSMTKRA